MATGPLNSLSYSGPESHSSSESNQSSLRQKLSLLPPLGDPSTLPSRMIAPPSKAKAAPTSCWAQQEPNCDLQQLETTLLGQQRAATSPLLEAPHLHASRRLKRWHTPPPKAGCTPSSAAPLLPAPACKACSFPRQRKAQRGCREQNLYRSQSLY